MSQTATIPAPDTASLDAMYGLIRNDLTRVDTLILARVKSEIPLIHDVARHIIGSGGKRIRPALTLICAKLCGYEGDRHIALAASIEFIHTATLLHDDVVDASKLRRGMPTANEIFGNKASVLVGDFLLSQAFQLMVADGAHKVMKILADSSAIIAQGEVLQLMTEGQPQTTVENYLKVISSKTAVLFAAACELGAIASDKVPYEAPMRDFGMHIGVAFQLIDDVLDYAADQQLLGKTVGDDFREGKVTLPVIVAYAAGTPEEKAFWQRTLSQREQTPDDLPHAIALLRRHNALAQTFSMAESYCQKARQALGGFAPGPVKAAMLDIVDFCASRGY
jgi:octaprenyl-diphosphate synthase